MGWRAHPFRSALQGGLAGDGDHAADSSHFSGHGAYAAQAHGGLVGDVHLVRRVVRPGGGSSHDQGHVNVLLLVDALQVVVHILQTATDLEHAACHFRLRDGCTGDRIRCWKRVAHDLGRSIACLEFLRCILVRSPTSILVILLSPSLEKIPQQHPAPSAAETGQYINMSAICLAHPLSGKTEASMNKSPYFSLPGTSGAESAEPLIPHLCPGCIRPWSPQSTKPW